MIVLKFGGTSVGTAESLANVKNIVESLNDDAVIVVSALGGLTDNLIATAELAVKTDNRSEYLQNWEKMKERHLNIIDKVIDNSKRKEASIEVILPLLDELLKLYDGINLINHLPKTTLARIVSLGERISSVIVANMITGATHADSLQIIKTEKWFEKNIAATELTYSLIKSKLKNVSFPVVMGGFISTDKDTGEITNLGRGGSDYTASLVAAALDADSLQIWTDVDGFLTADPRIVADAKVIQKMSFVESMDLCNFGAKVIYPPTIYPVFHKNIPIRILNTHRPDAPGTLITDLTGNDNDNLITGLSALKGEALITLRGRLAYETTEISSRSLNALSKNGLSPRPQSKAEAHNIFQFAIPACEADLAIRLLKEEFAPELANSELESIEMTDSLASLAVVGDKIKEIKSLSGRILELLESAGIDVFAFSDRSSETFLSYMIGESDVAKGLQTLHASFF